MGLGLAPCLDGFSLALPRQLRRSGMIRKWNRQVFTSVLLSVAMVAPVASFAQTVESGAGKSNVGSTPSTTGIAADSKDYYPAIDGASETAGKPRKEVQPVFYAARRFSIPFSVAPTGRQPVEVQLLLSRDGGEKWQTYERARPEARGFSFAAEEDGGFWFSLRTIDERGMAYPNQNEMLYVVIDTTKPDVGLSVDMNHEGEILAQCTIAELWIDPNSVVLEYQTDTELKWNAIPVEFKPGSIPGLFTGEKSWQPDVAVRNVMVRLSAADRAGNKAEITRMYSVPRTASLGGLQLASQKQAPQEDVVAWPEQRATPLQHTPGASPWVPGVSTKGTEADRLTQTRDNQRILPGTAVAQGTASGSIDRSSAIAKGGSHAPGRSVAQWESTKLGNEPATERYANNGSIKMQAEPRVAAPEPNTQLARSDSRQQGPGRLAGAQEEAGELRLSDSVPVEPTRIEGLNDRDVMGPSFEGPSFEGPRGGAAVEELPAPEPMPAPAMPAPTMPVPKMPVPKMLVETERPAAPAVPRAPQAPVATDNDARGNADLGNTDLGNTDLGNDNVENDPHAVPMGPTEQNTYYSRAKSFSLDYGIDMTRGSQVASIELWGTMDDGKTWSKWGEDEDRESPFDIRVDEEGMFGFRVVIVGSNLIASNQPRAGDPADAWIYVDTKAPDVKIISAVYGSGEEAGNLVINYSCADEQLIERPISISFSERRDGPWTTVASGLKNTGRYLWPAEPNLPKRIYLRIEAVDRAANIGVYRLDLPIDVEGLTPRGRIKGFRPITD